MRAFTFNPFNHFEQRMKGCPYLDRGPVVSDRGFRENIRMIDKLLVALFLPIFVFAFAKTAVAENSDGSYEACEDVDFSAPGCLPANNILIGLTEARDIARAIQFLQASAALYKRNLQTNISYYQQILGCYQSASPKCNEALSVFKKGLKESYRKLRQELALARRPPFASESVTAHPKAHINVAMGSVDDLPNPVGTDRLNATELQQAKATFKIEHDKIKSDYDRKIKELSSSAHRHLPDTVRHSELVSLYRQMERRHAAAYLSELTDHPHLMYLDAALSGRDDWTDEQVKAGIEKLIAAAKNEIGRTDAAVATGRIEFDRYNGESTIKGYFQNKAELLDYVRYPDLVNEVLSHDKSLCGIAVTLARRANSKDNQNIAIDYVIESIGAKGAGRFVPYIRSIVLGGIGVGRMAIVATQIAMGGATLKDAKDFIKPMELPQEMMGESGLEP